MNGDKRIDRYLQQKKKKGRFFRFFAPNLSI